MNKKYKNIIWYDISTIYSSILSDVTIYYIIRLLNYCIQVAFGLCRRSGKLYAQYANSFKLTRWIGGLRAVAGAYDFREHLVLGGPEQTYENYTKQ